MWIIGSALVEYLVLFQLPLDHIGCLFMGLLNGNLLSLGDLSSMQQGSDHPQGARQRLIQMDVPVQELVKVYITYPKSLSRCWLAKLFQQNLGKRDSAH
jgi:hypothetical protein